MSCAQEEIIADSVVLTKKQYDLLMDQIASAKYSTNYFLKNFKVDKELGGTYNFTDEADRSVFEQAKKKLEEKA